MMTINDAREFAFTPHTRQEWRAAILDVYQGGLVFEYLLTHSPYSTVRGVRGAETRALNKAIPKVREIIALHGQMRHTYFWTPRGNRAYRDTYAAERSNEVEFYHQGRRIHVNQETTCSTRNIYYSLSVYVDGVKKDVRVLRKIVALANDRFYRANKGGR